MMFTKRFYRMVIPYVTSESGMFLLLDQEYTKDDHQHTKTLNSHIILHKTGYPSFSVILNGARPN